MKYFLIIKLILIFTIITGCETIKKKSDEIVKKENEKLSKFIGQPESELKILMGNPDSETKDEKGNRLLIYKTKKYSISCIRKFEINEGNMIVGFTSKGCFWYYKLVGTRVPTNKVNYLFNFNKFFLFIIWHNPFTCYCQKTIF